MEIEETEEGRAHRADAHLAGVVPDADCHLFRVASGDDVERRRPALDVLVARVVQVPLRELLAVVRTHEVHAVRAVGILEQVRCAEKQAIRDAEHRSVRADAERERDNDRDRETRLFPESTNRILDVLPDGFDSHLGPLCAARGTSVRHDGVENGSLL